MYSRPSTVVRVNASTLDANSLRGLRVGIDVDLNPGDIVLDLSAVSRVDLEGLCTLRACQRAIQERGGRIIVQAMSPEVRHQVELVPFARLAMLEMAHA